MNGVSCSIAEEKHTRPEDHFELDLQHIRTRDTSFILDHVLIGFSLLKDKMDKVFEAHLLVHRTRLGVRVHHCLQRLLGYARK